jgi:hypothetical protein
LVEIRLTTDPHNSTILTFDGRVLELFWMTSRQSARYHVFQIAKIELSTDKHGQHSLDITSRYVNQIMLGGQPVRPEVLAETQALVEVVRQAMALYP